MYSFIPDGLSGHDDTLKAAYGDGEGKPDAAKAKKVLEDAGVSTPVDLKLQYNGDHYGSSSADEYAAIKSQLEADGLFKVDLQQTEWTQYNKERVVTEDSDGSYPVYQLGCSRTTPIRTTTCPRSSATATSSTTATPTRKSTI